MRITNSLQYGDLQRNVETSLENFTAIQGQISTGKKLNSFADDPAGASQSLSLRGAAADNTQYQRDADAAKSYLSASDAALSSVTAVVQSARQIAVQAANSTQSSDGLAALSSQVDGIIAQVTQLANSDLHGTYLFGGTQTKTPPFDATQTYRGNDQSRSAAIGPNYTLQTGVPGDAAFGPAFSALQSLKQHLSDAAAGTAGALDALSGDVARVDTGLTALSAAQASVGARSAEADSVKRHLTQAQTQYQTAISNIEDVDLASAYVQLQSAQNVYQASLATTAKAAQYSLADFLH